MIILSETVLYSMITIGPLGPIVFVMLFCQWARREYVDTMKSPQRKEAGVDGLVNKTLFPVSEKTVNVIYFYYANLSPRSYIYDQQNCNSKDVTIFSSDIMRICC